MIDRKCMMCVFPEKNIKAGRCKLRECKIKAERFKGDLEFPNWMRG